MDFDNKVAIITGAAGGIGRASALVLAGYGADIVAIDLKEDGINKTIKDVEEAGRKGLALAVDITKLEQVQLAVKNTIDKFGNVDILVNAAGVDIAATIENLTESVWDLHMNVNLKGTFFCCQAVLDSMKKKGKGKIVNISSQAGKLGEIGQAAYGCSKAGVSMLTQVLALEMAQYGINVNAICPGLVATEMLENAIIKLSKERNIPLNEFKKSWIDKIPMKRMARPEEIAELVAFLSSEGSDYMTGISYTIAGGLTLI